MKHGLVLLFLLLSGGIAGIAAWAYSNGRWIPNACGASNFPIRGIDVSHHQGEIDWPMVLTRDIDFIYIKATEGCDFIDPQFAKNWKKTAGKSINRGAYHFFSPTTPGQEQARHFISIVPSEQGALPPAVDLEFAVGHNSSPTISHFRSQLEDFLKLVRDAYGKEPVIYTTYEFYNYYLAGIPIRRLWIRNILFRPRDSMGSSWTFWQYSNKGRIPGISTFVDLNVFRGNRDQFNLFKK